ncbi:rhomboid family intramembrane serine protease [bacterium]|nr:rhomboid family intramembrane serine protease [bacterium]
MGLSSRDYYRDDSYSRGGDGWLSDTPTVRSIIVLTAVIFVLQHIITQQKPIVINERMVGTVQTSVIDDWFALNNRKVQQGQVWRLVTYVFLHDTEGLWHILLNMYFFWFTGSSFERMYGGRELWRFYLLSAFLAGLGEFLLTTAFHIPSVTVGASGAVMAVFMVYGMHYPRRIIYVMWIIPLEIRWAIALYVAFDLFPILQLIGGRGGYAGVAHACHLIGLLFGYLYYRNQWRLDRFGGNPFAGWSKRWKVMKAGQRLKVYAPTPSPTEPTTDLEVELDRILAKIHEHGTGSLTAKEERILAEASERAKRRGSAGPT